MAFNAKQLRDDHGRWTVSGLVQHGFMMTGSDRTTETGGKRKVLMLDHSHNNGMDDTSLGHVRKHGSTYGAFDHKGKVISSRHKTSSEAAAHVIARASKNGRIDELNKRTDTRRRQLESDIKTVRGMRKK